MSLERYRVAVVSGASRGIGAAIVRALRQRAIEVHALARGADDLRALADETGCVAHAIDVTDRDGVLRCLAGLPVDIMVCSAAVLGASAPVFEADGAAVEATLRANVAGTINCLAATVPGMRRRGLGHVVTISSLAALHTLPGMPLYGMTKAALHNMTGSLRLDLHGSGVRVTEIAPGRVRTGIHLDMLPDRAEARRRFYDGYQCLEAEDIAAAALFALDAPQRMNVSVMEILPTDQSCGGSQFVQRPARAAAP